MAPVISGKEVTWRKEVTQLADIRLPIRIPGRAGRAGYDTHTAGTPATLSRARHMVSTFSVPSPGSVERTKGKEGDGRNANETRED